MDSKKKSLLRLAVPAVVAVIVASTLLAVYFSPSSSWSSSVRDSDRDGVPDARDAFPNDPGRSLPLITLSTAVGNHNWTLTVESISTATGDTARGIAIDEVRVETGDSAGASQPVTSLQALTRNPSVNGVTYTDAADQTSLNEGDAFVLALSEYRPGSYFALTNNAGEGAYCALNLTKDTPSETGGQGWTAESFRWTFTSLSPQVSWNDVEIHISDGHTEASWSPNLISDDENTSLPITGLGPLSLVCTLRSAVHNTVIDSGDNFSIIPSPGFDPEKTYRISVLYDFGGEIASCSFRLSAPPEPIPTLNLDLISQQGDYVYVEFSSVSGALSWDDIAILLSGETTTIVWIVNASELDGGGLSTTVCGTSMLDGMTITCEVGDLAGNGVVNDADGFQLTSNPGFLDITDYQITVLFKPNWQAMASLSFSGQPVTPTTMLTKSTVTDGVKFTFAPVSMDTQWDDVAILLSDGSYTATWFPATIDLVNGSTSIWNSIAASANIGTLRVNITVVDLAGNGYINQGDYFALRLGPGQSFSSATIYTVTIMYNPTSAEICHLDFQGEAGITPISSLTKSTITNGLKFTFAPMSLDTPWSDVTILLSDGSNTTSWSPLTIDLDNGTTAKWNHIVVAANLGTLKVNISITDLAGNGYVNQGDYFVLVLGPGQVFSVVTTYTVVIMHDPTASEICHIVFTG